MVFAGAALLGGPGLFLDLMEQALNRPSTTCRAVRRAGWLLAALLARPGAVLSRLQLMERVWEDAAETGDRTVDTHVKTLRAKLRAAAPAADPLRTHRGVGYSLDVD